MGEFDELYLLSHERNEEDLLQRLLAEYGENDEHIRKLEQEAKR